ncbi:tetratricopeptide repeat protein [Aurantimonas sp. MSK8Z-1]|uniref:tetratricopeptide repeat protein n=1 Tax=Mangrovibrevibacter kandeliae TaxID=2968473 RepID=UPI0021175F60|nr:tetratricopeptide repeat protein [Aurantimonas sp. MSK8Z-1]MCW4116496.1 tetratricopeptide repeat protein [Aurantimonas sp. MSK8Z-1]
MSDDSFFREVHEDLRRDKVQAVWRRYGGLLIGGAVLVVLIAAGLVWWEAHRTSQLNTAGDAYLSALDLADQGKTDEAVTALQAIAEDAPGAYPVLAKLRIAGVREAAGDTSAAVEAYDAVAADGDAPQPLRDVAAIRAGYILVDTGSLDDVRSRVERLSSDAEPLRFAAREAIGLASWKAGDVDNARTLFQELRDDQGAPSGISGRAAVMLDVIAAGDKDAVPAEPAAGGDGAAAPDAAPSVDALPGIALPTTLPDETTPPSAAPEAAVPPAAAPDAQTSAPDATAPEVASPATSNAAGPETPAPATDAPTPSAADTPAAQPAPAPDAAPVPAPDAPAATTSPSSGG